MQPRLGVAQQPPKPCWHGGTGPLVLAILRTGAPGGSGWDPGASLISGRGAGPPLSRTTANPIPLED